MRIFFTSLIVVIAEIGNNKYMGHKIESSGIYYEYISKIKLTTDTFLS